MTSAPCPMVFAGDLLRVLHELGAPQPMWPEIARTLGMRLRDPAPSMPRAEPAADPADRGRRRSPPLPTREGVEGSSSLGSSTARPPRARPLRPSELRALDSSPPPPLWLATADVVDLPAPGSGRRPSPESLLAARWSRGILSMMLATRAPSGEVDVVVLIDEIARARPLTAVPRRQRSTLARGAQICVDMAQAMIPFAHDQAEVVRAVHALIGGSPLETLYFAGCPARGAGPGHRATWSPYTPPSPRRPVLLLSDLGVGRPRLSTEPALPSEWASFAGDLESAGCPVVALVPYPGERVPPRLRRSIHVIPWDRPTNVSTIRHALGAALEMT